MARKTKTNGFTLVEVMIALAIMMILTTVFLAVSDVVKSNAKTTLTMSTINVFDEALELYRDFNFQLQGNDYKSYRFPFDLRDYTSDAKRDNWLDNDGNDETTYDNDEYFNGIKTSSAIANELRVQLENAFGLNAGDVKVYTGTSTSTNPEFTKYDTDKIDNRYCFSSLAAIIILNRVPQCRDMLSAISDSNITRKDEDGKVMTIDIDGKLEAAYLITDAWGVPLRYRYDGEQVFPVIESAGPDGKFDTEDDICNTD